MYVTICAGRDVVADGGFVPLTVNYMERFSAAGKTSGGYRKRDGGVREHETLIGRLVDRPLRPMIPKAWAYETQILQWVLSYDGNRNTDALAITAASAAAAVSDVPLSKPVCGVRCVLYVHLSPYHRVRVVNVVAKGLCPAFSFRPPLAFNPQPRFMPFNSN
jgi:polyribonucleotide nucleotidyltransferase